MSENEIPLFIILEPINLKIILSFNENDSIGIIFILNFPLGEIVHKINSFSQSISLNYKAGRLEYNGFILLPNLVNILIKFEVN